MPLPLTSMNGSVPPLLPSFAFLPCLSSLPFFPAFLPYLSSLPFFPVLPAFLPCLSSLPFFPAFLPLLASQFLLPPSPYLYPSLPSPLPLSGWLRDAAQGVLAKGVQNDLA